MAVQQQMRRLVTTTSQSLVDFQGEQTVTIGGLITQRRVQLTKNGDRMAFVTLEDLYGSLEVIVFPETYRQSVAACESEEPVIVWGKAKIEGEGGEPRVIAQRVLLLKDALALGEFRRLTLSVSPQHDRTTLLHVRDLLGHTPGSCQVVLVLLFPDGERVLLRAAEHLNVAPSLALLAGLEELLGTENVRVA
jgi:DNA polymerase-3 subunit alpha